MAAHRPRQRQHPPWSCCCLHTVFPGRSWCEDMSECQPVYLQRGGKMSHRVWGHLAFCIGAALGWGVGLEQLWLGSLRSLGVL